MNNKNYVLDWYIKHIYRCYCFYSILELILEHILFYTMKRWKNYLRGVWNLKKKSISRRIKERGRDIGKYIPN